MKRRTTPISVQSALSGKRILLTGTTGFLAKVVLEKLIRAVPSVGRIILVIRGNRNCRTARALRQGETPASATAESMAPALPAVEASPADVPPWHAFQSTSFRFAFLAEPFPVRNLRNCCSWLRNFF